MNKVPGNRQRGIAIDNHNNDFDPALKEAILRVWLDQSSLDGGGY